MQLNFKKRYWSVYSKEYLEQSRQSPWGSTQRDQKEGLEFGEKEYDQIDNYCKKKLNG